MALLAEVVREDSLAPYRFSLQILLRNRTLELEHVDWLATLWLNKRCRFRTKPEEKRVQSCSIILPQSFDLEGSEGCLIESSSAASPVSGGCDVPCPAAQVFRNLLPGSEDLT